MPGRRRPLRRLPGLRRSPGPTSGAVLLLPLPFPVAEPASGSGGGDRERILRAVSTAVGAGPRGEPMDAAWVRRAAEQVADELAGPAPPGAPPAPDPLRDARILAAIRTVAERMPVFSSDDVWDFLPEERGTRRLGNLLKTAAAKGICATTDDFAPSRHHRRNHGRAVRVWKSLLRPGDSAG